MPHPAQPDVAIIVPKVDELVGVLEALGEERLPKPSDSIQHVDINLETYRLELSVSRFSFPRNELRSSSPVEEASDCTTLPSVSPDTLCLFSE